MRKLGWQSSLQVTALLVVAFWLVGSVLQAILSFNLTGAPPPEKPDFLDSQEAFFAFETSRWRMEFAANALFALGFATFAGVGVLLSRLASADDARRSLGAAAFIGAGLIGALGPLIWIAFKPLLTSPDLCPCGFRAEEVTSRLVVLGVTDSLTMWLNIGFITLAVVGVVLVTSLAAEAGMGRGWAMYSYLVAAAGVVVALGAALGLEPYAYYSTIVLAGILIPVWALWVAIRGRQLIGPDGSAAGPIDPGSIAT